MNRSLGGLWATVTRLTPGERSPSQRSIRLSSALRTALPGWITARVFVAAALLLARALIGQGVFDDAAARGTVSSGLFGWDAAFYARIAQQGYERLPQDALRFFPLTPLLGRAVGWVGVGPRAGVLLVSNFSALLAGALLVVLVRREGFTPEIGRRSAWLLALAPPAFVLSFAYGESVFLALAIGIFLAARRQQWLVVIGLGLLAGFSRPGGFVVSVPIAVEAARAFSAESVRKQLLRAGSVMAPVAGAALFLGWVGNRFGDALLPYRVQTRSNLKGPFTDPFTSMTAAIRGIAHENFGTALHVPWILGVVALVVLAFRWLPASYGAYSIATVASALTSANLDSFERYALGAFPIVIVTAIVARKTGWARIVIGLSAIAMMFYATLAFVHRSVP